MRGIALLLIVMTLTFYGAVSFAMDKLDLAIGMKTLPLLNNQISGNIKVAILYDPAKASSKQEAETIKSIIDSGLDLPADLNPDGVIIPVNQLEKLADIKIAIITSNIESHYDAIGNAANKYNILTMSTDLDCVRMNKCVLGIVSKPRVEIYYSKSAAESARISFKQAFATLLKPVPN
jgi:hypothetical protein